MNSFSADQILYEDNHLIAVNKLPGQLVQGDITGDLSLMDLIKDYIKVKYNKPGNVFLGCIHRLDRPVSGVCIFAKTSKALSRMNKLFADRNITKLYWAAVSNAPEIDSDTLVHFLVKDQNRNKSFVSSKSNKASKRAELAYDLIHASKKFYVLDISLSTGRPHQIRVQLSTMGCPIIGDLKYGFPKANKDASICLHCHILKFTHPVSDLEIEIAAEVPNIPEWQNFKSV
jgi:23S rRNA pseudouridine1911/1915/1917 synthase